MVETQVDFRKRLSVLGRKHVAMSNGYTSKVRHDGLIVVTPKRRNPTRFIPVKGMVLFIVGFLVFKAFMFAALGESTYTQRIAKLAEGTLLEQGGAWIMHADPVTQVIARYIEPITR
ncbi:hypothetical protein [uncultured Tateyamaria sp.]|uniref:hypothetical protein n=1 Tax=uncultured Tateyamaria sp. TaxID=455651 RepID=UPI0026017660|nr:hypothetical protein [uncultured Tateyamaria sp.]